MLKDSYRTFTKIEYRKAFDKIIVEGFFYYKTLTE